MAGEEERGTLDLLLAHPLRRRDYVVQRFLALAVARRRSSTSSLLATVALGSLLVDLEIGFGKLVAATGERRRCWRSSSERSRSRPARSGRAARGRSRSPPASPWRLALRRARAGGRALDRWRPLSPYYQALGQNPLREGVPWDGWAILAARPCCSSPPPSRLERRDVRQ